MIYELGIAFLWLGSTKSYGSSTIIGVGALNSTRWGLLRATAQVQ